jgi:hypothetical protein
MSWLYAMGFKEFLYCVHNDGSAILDCLVSASESQTKEVGTLLAPLAT